MNIKQINPEEAYDKMQNENASYLDVRTEKEFQEGHALGAINVPVFFIEDGVREPNPHFIDKVKKEFKPDTVLVVGCRTGGRSHQACQILANTGFTNLYNIDGGFIGTPEKDGWSSLGLPCEE